MFQFFETQEVQDAFLRFQSTFPFAGMETAQQVSNARVESDDHDTAYELLFEIAREAVLARMWDEGRRDWTKRVMKQFDIEEEDADNIWSMTRPY